MLNAIYYVSRRMKTSRERSERGGRWRASSLLVGAVAALVAVSARAAPSSAEHVANLSQASRVYRLLRLLPVTTGSAGFVYRYNRGTGVFDREGALTAQVFIDRPATIGAGQWSLNGNALYLSPSSRRSGRLYVTSLGATYGLTDDTELNLTVPLLVFANRSGTTASFDPVILRAKYNFHVGGTVETAVGLAVRTLTVHAAAKNVELIPQVHLSTRPYRPTDGIHLQPYLDLGFAITALSDADARWGLGLDAALGDQFVLGLAFLGRSAIGGVLKPFNNGSVALFDAAVTGRVALWGDRLSAVAGVLMPLDRGEEEDFDVVPTVGLEVGF